VYDKDMLLSKVSAEKFQGGECQRIKDPSGGGGGKEKDRKIAKALLSFYLLYLYHVLVWKSRGRPPAPAADAHDYSYTNLSFWQIYTMSERVFPTTFELQHVINQPFTNTAFAL